jgi:membrane protease YdiL (CAAX protease family)
MNERIPLGRAVATVIVAFVAAQLAAKLSADVAGTLVHHGTKLHSVRGVASAEVIVPSMLASQLVLLLAALSAPLSLALPVRTTLRLHAAAPEVFVAASLGTVMLGPLGDVLMTTMARVFPGATLGVVPALHEIARKLPIWALWPAFAFMPGVAEELLFRGVLQGAAGRSVFAVLLSGVGFALFHVDPVHVAGVLPLGLFLAWVAQRSSTLVTLVAHVANNTIAVLTIHTATLDVGYGTERELPWPWVVVSLGLVAVCMRVVAQSTRPHATDG